MRQDDERLVGVIGLVDLSDADWTSRVEANRRRVNFLAIPGNVDQAWAPEFQPPTGHEWARAAGDIPFFAMAAGIWINPAECVSDGLAYTDQSVLRTRVAADAGASHALVPTPLGLRPLAGQSGSALVYRYFRDVQAKSPIPLVIYQPIGTPEEYRLEPDSILSLVRLGKVAGLILEDGKLEEFEPVVRAGRRSRFSVFCAPDLFPAAFDEGASGVAVPIDSPGLDPLYQQVTERLQRSK